MAPWPRERDTPVVPRTSSQRGPIFQARPVLKVPMTFLLAIQILLVSCAAVAAVAQWTDLPAWVCNLAGLAVLMVGVASFL